MLNIPIPIWGKNSSTTIYLTQLFTTLLCNLLWMVGKKKIAYPCESEKQLKYTRKVS